MSNRHHATHLALVSWTEDAANGSVVTFQARDFHGYKIVNAWSTDGEEEYTYVETGYERRCNITGRMVKETWDFNSDEDAAAYIEKLLGEGEMADAYYSSREDMEREWCVRK